MSDYTIDVNGKRYELSEDFRQAIQRLAKSQYGENSRFNCWWKNDDGPTLVIETVGRMVPWDKLDQLERQMEEADDDRSDEERLFGRMHFGVTPHRFEEIPEPGGDDPEKIPPKKERVDDEMVVMWIPNHPDVNVTWSSGEAMTAMDSWVEWNVQERAEQPRPSSPSGYKENSHDAFESLCRIHDCEVVAEAKPSNDIPPTQEESGSVERKGKSSFENGKFEGDNWSR